MILSFKHKFIYIKTMKTGGTSTELALSSICGPDDVITSVTSVEEVIRKQRYGQYCRNFHRNKRAEQSFINQIENELEKSGSVAMFNMMKDRGTLFCDHMPLSEVIRVAAEVYPDCRLDDFLVIFNVRDPHDLLRSYAHFGAAPFCSLLDCDLESKYRAYIDTHFRSFISPGTISAILPIDGFEQFDHHIIKYENLQAGFDDLMEKFGLDHIELPVTKQSVRKQAPQELFTPEEMEWIRRSFRGYAAKFGYERHPVRAPTYSLGTELHFAGDMRSPDSLLYFTEGLSSLEPGLPYIWSLGHQTTMEMTIEQAVARDVIVQMEFGACLAPHGQKIGFYANGERLGQTMVGQNHGLSRKFRIPQRLVQDTTLSLRFEYPCAVSPAELYGSTDERTLAVGYKKICIREEDDKSDHNRIFLISTPRSGNSWVRSVLRDAFGLDEIAAHNIFDLPLNLPDNLILQIHWYREPTIQALITEQDCKVIVIARHPLDVLVSVLHFTRHDQSPDRWLEGNCEIPHALRSATPSSSAFLDYALSWGAENLLSVAYQWWHDHNTIKLRYEDLIADPIASLQSLAKSLRHASIPVEEWAAALSNNSLGKFQALQNKHGWQGRPNLWRELLTPHIASQIYHRHKRVFDVLGYSLPPYALSEEEAERNWERLKA